ncbi:MAG: MBL fold metallo-hydrolase RNA specificity domain-containing protein [Pirellulales bacterium]
MFHYDNGLFLTRAALGVDVRRRQPRSFVSHAHADHIARHELALATPTTARLYQHRLGRHHRVLEVPFREPLEFGSVRLTALPAGHCFGSAMLLAEEGDSSLLYTGDFKLGDSATAEPAELSRADILVMESTFGLPRYRLPPRSEVIEELLHIVRGAIAQELTPVIHAYPLGKSQEVTRILTDAGIRVLQHPAIYEVSRIYEACGMSLGNYDVYPHQSAIRNPKSTIGSSPAAIVTLPRGMNSFRLAGLGRTVTIAPTGWAIDPRTKFRWGVDYALPLSDHADYDQLLETIERVAPREIYCTHGPEEFADILRDMGYNAQTLAPRKQRTLF